MSTKFKKISYFIIFTYFITILFYIILELIGGRSNSLTMNLIGLSMVIPILSVIVVQKGIFHQKLINCLGLPFKFNFWIIPSILIPIILAIIIFFASKYMLGIIVFPDNSFLMNILLGLTIASISALIEEVAWRGFLFNELKNLGFLKASIFIGIVWGLWHLPVKICISTLTAPLQDH